MDTDIISVRHTRQQIHLFNTYQAICQKDHVADLNALSRFVVGQMYSGKMQPLNLTHLVVDEVQDTDSIQYARSHYIRGQVLTLASLGMMIRQFIHSGHQVESKYSSSLKNNSGPTYFI